MGWYYKSRAILKVGNTSKLDELLSVYKVPFRNRWFVQSCEHGYGTYNCKTKEEAVDLFLSEHKFEYKNLLATWDGYDYF